MRSLLLNLLLALTWAAMTAEFSPRNLLVGFGLGFLVLLAARRMLGDIGYFKKVRQVIGFVGFFLWELLLANFRVAYDIVTPRLYMQPGVVAIPLDATTPGCM
jgi:multicomponent Na+:H+ antiporter subunit E